MKNSFDILYIMIQKLSRLTFEISLLFIIGALLTIFINFYLTDQLIQIVFSAVYFILSILLFLNLRLENKFPQQKVSLTLLKFMFIGLMGIPFYSLLYLRTATNISAEVILTLNLITVFVSAYCTIFKNSSSGFTGIFVDHLFRRTHVTADNNKFIVLMCTGILMCVWILLSLSMVNYMLS